ncbi:MULTISPECIES: hypothetical protein [Chromobacterium]|uniref:hypothetical protein n=1 Tax=Chromobacterium TaxID=535 RepID=UPI001746B6FF|nr:MULTISPECIES: hypothetical protein [Chromobacterium]MDH0344658.1 hypothetical protein [Chromobacterium haemolyticum]QOD85027.1 hypothetical protein IEZ30_11330 [Chromobacterium haemolyticum]
MDFWITGEGVTQAASLASYTAIHFPRQLSRVRLKRIPFWGKGITHQGGAIRDKPPGPGHYWVEIAHDDPSITESYGWYPAANIAGMESKLDQLSAMWDVEGCINGDSKDRRDADKENPKKKKYELLAGRGIGHHPYPYDPNHGNPKARSVQPLYLGLTDQRAETAVIEEIRAFAAAYTKQSGGRWSYRLDSFGEANCHTFIWRMLHDCQLIDLELLNADIDPHFDKLRGLVLKEAAKGAVFGGPGVIVATTTSTARRLIKPDYVDKLVAHTTMTRDELKRRNWL